RHYRHSDLALHALLQCAEIGGQRARNGDREALLLGLGRGLGDTGRIHRIRRGIRCTRGDQEYTREGEAAQQIPEASIGTYIVTHFSGELPTESWSVRRAPP